MKKKISGEKVEKLKKGSINFGNPFGAFEKTYDLMKVGDKINEIIEVLNAKKTKS